MKLFSNPMQKNKGMTLVETMMGIFIGIILIMIVSFGFIIITRLNQTNAVISNLTTSTDRSIYRITSTIQQSNQILSSTVINSTTYTTSSTVLVLKVPSIDSLGQVIVNSYDTVIYRKNPSNSSELQEITDAQINSIRIDGTHIFSRFVTNLLFRYNNTDVTLSQLATVYLKNGNYVRGELKESANQATVRLRNY